MSSTTATTDSSVSDNTNLPPIRWWPVLGIAGGLVTVLLALSGRHGYHLDELYYRVSGENLAWGYLDQPPLVPLIARLETVLFGDTLIALRIAPALLAATAVLLATLIARELGGNGPAQALAGMATAASLVTLNSGHILTTNAVDPVVWVAVCWLTIRLLRTRDTRLWLVIGAVAGLGLLAKYLVVLLIAGLLAGMVVTGPREVLRSRHLLAGAGVAVLIVFPNLVWQVLNDLPQLEMATALSTAFGSQSRIAFVPFQLLLIGLPLSPLWIAGLIGLLRRPQWRAYRSVGVSYLLVVVLLLLIAGKPEYTSGLLVVLLAAGCVTAAHWAKTVTRRVLVGVAVVGNALMSAVLMLPVLPIETYAGNPLLQQLGIVQLDQAGWPQLAGRAAGIYRSLPPEDQARAVFFTGHYGQAGALDRFGPEHGLPPAYSGHNSYADFGRPTDDKTVVITIGVDQASFSNFFARCEQQGRFDIDLPVSDQGQEFMVCREPRVPWSQLWPQLRWIGFQCPGTAKPVTATSEEGCD